MQTPNRVSLGHGTQNDFLLVDDPEGNYTLTPEWIQKYCHRRQGVGADGVIRLIKTENLKADELLRQSEPELIAQVEQLAEVPTWFMDYRNADGSIAEMCGNGVRVFGLELLRRGYVQETAFPIYTRAGVKTITVLEQKPNFARIQVGMGVFEPQEKVEVKLGGQWFSAQNFSLGNPHTVTIVDPQADLDSFELPCVAEVKPVPEQGTNAEFVQVITPGHARMRVIERGVGETQSCGTGACAAIAALWQNDPAQTHWQLDVPGGELEVEIAGDQTCKLAGPAEITAEIELL